jgi:hypothetical protein
MASRLRDFVVVDFPTTWLRTGILVNPVDKRRADVVSD